MGNGTEIEVFDMTDEHLKLVSRLCVGNHNGQPAISGKRPFGNSNIIMDVFEILEWSQPDWDSGGVWSNDDKNRAKKIVREVATALEVALHTGAFDVGRYMRRLFFGVWQKVPEDISQ